MKSYRTPYENTNGKPILSPLATGLRKCRGKRTQTAFAALTGLSQATISRNENGVTIMSLDDLEKVIAACPKSRTRLTRAHTETVRAHQRALKAEQRARTGRRPGGSPRGS
jgi:transcriptional regulator with XRE-family HTH domain